MKMKMATIVKWFDTTYGGYHYVEYIEQEKIYKVGETRAHRGHYRVPQHLNIVVKTKGELNNVARQLHDNGFELDTSY